ncbi:MAG: hypothetical protein WC680_10215 [Sulfuricurvum sp.]
MTGFWKVIISFNLLISCMALLMLYDRLTYNPYDDISEEITEIQTELRQLAVDSQEIKQDFENINSNVARR